MEGMLEFKDGNNYRFGKEIIEELGYRTTVIIEFESAISAEMAKQIYSKIKKPTRIFVRGWVIVIHKGQQYLTVNPIEPDCLQFKLWILESGWACDSHDKIILGRVELKNTLLNLLSLAH